MTNAESGLVDEPFDSELLGLRIGRLRLPATDPTDRAKLIADLAARGHVDGYDQLLSRVPLSALSDVWALESVGFEVMDVGVTFTRTIDPSFIAPTPTSCTTRLAADADIETLLVTMLDVPWGSRYEADPAYDRSAVQRLQTRWLRNSLRGRADAVWVGDVDGTAMGYATCRVVTENGAQEGEIDLVGTVPAARRRGIAKAVVDAALGWFAPRVPRVTVRTQATNYTAAALYERAGMTLHHTDVTLRLALTTLGGQR